VHMAGGGVPTRGLARLRSGLRLATGMRFCSYFQVFLRTNPCGDAPFSLLLSHPRGAMVKLAKRPRFFSQTPSPSDKSRRFARSSAVSDLDRAFPAH